jgi:hypothetical protein
MYCADGQIAVVIAIEVPCQPISDVLSLREYRQGGQACEQQGGNRTAK